MRVRAMVSLCCSAPESRAAHAVLQRREQAEDLVDPLRVPEILAAAAPLRADEKIVLDAMLVKDLAVLGHVADSRGRGIVGEPIAVAPLSAAAHLRKPGRAAPAFLG